MLDIDLFSLPFFLFSWLCSFTNAFIGFLYLDIKRYAYMCFMDKLEYKFVCVCVCVLSISCIKQQQQQQQQQY